MLNLVSYTIDSMRELFKCGIPADELICGIFKLDFQR